MVWKWFTIVWELSKWVIARLYILEFCSWASYKIRKVAGCACAVNAGNVFPTRRLQRKPLVSDPGMHHATCVTHVPWCMSGSLTCGGGENVPGMPSACAPAILRIWQEAHGDQPALNIVFWTTYPMQRGNLTSNTKYVESLCMLFPFTNIRCQNLIWGVTMCSETLHIYNVTWRSPQ